MGKNDRSYMAYDTYRKWDRAYKRKMAYRRMVIYNVMVSDTIANRIHKYGIISGVKF